MSKKKKTNKIAEEKAFDYQRALGMIDSVSDDHVIARRIGFYDGFIAGAEWQKEQMMKDAVEGFVGVHLHDKRADVTVNTGYLPKEMGIRGDSKVRVIIVKEEEE